MNTSKERIHKFLSNFIKNTELEEDQNIFELGVVNSLFAMQLILFIEKEFDFSVDNEELDLENFKSINAIDSLITKHLKEDM